MTNQKLCSREKSGKVWRPNPGLAVLTVAFLALRTLLPGGAQASPITYDFAPGSTITFGTTTEGIAGHFTADISSVALTNVDISISGMFNITFNMPQILVNDAFTVTNSEFDTLDMGVEPNFTDTPLTVTLGGTALEIPSLEFGAGATAANATLTPVSTQIPEPTTLTLLIGALGLFIPVRWATRRDR